MCDAPRVPDGWRLLAFPSSALDDASIAPWDAADLACYAERTGGFVAAYGTPLPELAAEAHGSLSDFLEGAATAGHGCVAIDSIVLVLHAQHRWCIGEAQAMELAGVDGDALGWLDASGLRDLVVVAERLIAEMEHELAALYRKEQRREQADPCYRALWQRAAFAALARAASAEERAGSAEYDNSRKRAEGEWYESLGGPS
jgi:hypothetical protein